MQFNTLMKIGSLAMNVFQHDPFKQLTSIIGKGVQRRIKQTPGNVLPRQSTPHFPPPYGDHYGIPPYYHPGYGPTPPFPSGRKAAQKHPSNQKHPAQQGGFPPQPHELFKYVTPDNAKKILQWHGIIQEFAKIINPK